MSVSTARRTDRLNGSSTGFLPQKLRRENAKTWLCTSSTADDNGWANRVYFLQQKDGTLYS